MLSVGAVVEMNATFVEQNVCRLVYHISNNNVCFIRHFKAPDKLRSFKSPKQRCAVDRQARERRNFHGQAVEVKNITPSADWR